MPLTSADFAAIWLTLQLASLTTVLLLLIGTPIAWWLAHTRSRLKAPVGALVALPLVLPPTVIGFYLLVAMGPHGPVGQLTKSLGLGTLPFSFAGLLVGSLIYSLPFVVQPIQNAFEAIGRRPLEVAATLRASPWDCFLSVVLPLARPGFLTASVLGFAHTLGEFGVVLMIGGNIPDKTRVVSVQIFNHVEAMEYAKAHRARLIGVYASFMPSPNWFYMMEGAARYLEEDRHRRERVRDVMQGHFREATASMADQAEWRAVEGDPLALVLREAREADLLIVGQRDPDDPASFVAADFVETLILEAGRPVLAEIGRAHV